MVRLLLRLTAGPGRTEHLLEALHSVLQPLRADRECQDARILADVDEAGVLWYWEDWTDVEAFEDRVRSQDFGRLLAIVEMSATQPQLECRVTTDVRGLEYLAAIRGVAWSPATEAGRTTNGAETARDVL